jgi:hypothetical protein
MLAFLGAVTSASAQDKGTAVTSSAAVGLNDKSGNQAEVMIIETAEKDLPSASNVTEVSTRSVVRKEIVRTPEMLERKKQEPKLNEPQ